MKYTRYEYKKTGTMKILSSIAIIIGITVIGGFYIGSAVFKGKEIPTISSNDNHENVKGIESSEQKKLNIVVIQCGCFSKKENADAVLGTLTKYCQPFVSEQDGKFRVIAGIYNEESGDKKLQQLKENGIDVAKTTLNIDENSDSTKKIQEIFNGFFQITNKFEENDTKAINTSKFKEWCKTVVTDEDCESNEKIKNIYDCMNNLPEELERTNIVETEKQLYDIVR